MITSYATLKASILNYLSNRSDVASMIPEFIADGEARIYDELRIKAMEDSFSSAISSGVVALPTGFIEWKNLYIDGSSAQKITRKSAEWIYTNYPNRSAAGGGKPVFFAREGETLIFGPYPDTTYTVKGQYYKRLAALSDINTTNWFITNAPDLLRYAALCEAMPYIRKDDRVQLWEAKYQEAKNRVKRTDRNEAFSGSVLSVSAG